MKILFFSSYFYPYTSGITTYPFKILSYLAKNHRITVLTFNHKENKEEKELIKGLRIIRMPYLIKIYKGFISPQSFVFFLNQLKKNDLVIINLPNIEGLPLTLLAKIFNKKTISILHCFLGLSEKFYLKIVNLITNLIIAVQVILVDQIVGYDDYINNLFVSKLIKKKTRTILPPILKLRASKKKLNQLLKIKKKKIWIGYVGRISQEKGLEYLIKSVRLLSDADNIELVFAGPYGKDVVGENSYFLKIKQLLASKNINHRFFGNLENCNLGSFYKAIDILVLPSINRTEAFGMVQPEAMLIGTPVVATNLPGVRIPIKLTKMGIVIEPKNEKQLAKAIGKILKTRQKYTNKNLIKNAEKIFDIKKVYQFYDNLVYQINPNLTEAVKKRLVKKPIYE